MFLIYINDLPGALEKSQPDIYADDTDIFTSGNDLKLLEENANQELLKHVCSWLQANKLGVNTLKCKYMIIGSQYNLSCENYIPDIKLLGKSVERVYEFDQLGVSTDDKLNWSRHIEKLHKKLSSALFSTKQVKFLQTSSLVTTYRSLVESRLLYCNVVWGNCGSSFIEKLQCIQNRVTQLISKESESADLNKLFTDLSILSFLALENIDAIIQLFWGIEGDG